jgi:hypothetical protein
LQYWPLEWSLTNLGATFLIKILHMPLAVIIVGA